MKMNICYLGLIPFGEALEIQERLHALRLQGKIENTLLLLEHPPVITLGTRGKYDNIYLPRQELEEKGVTIFEINRGGDVTYHGPGQIVGYPIVDLSDLDRSIRPFVCNIENAIIALLQHEFGLAAETRSGKYTGVWVGDKKITAIGIAVSKWVTMHGFAFNVNTDLTHFDWINPCGLSMGVTSVQALIGGAVDMDNLFALVASYMIKAFDCESTEVSIDSLLV